MKNKNEAVICGIKCISSEYKTSWTRRKSKEQVEVTVAAVTLIVSIFPISLAIRRSSNITCFGFAICVQQSDSSAVDSAYHTACRVSPQNARTVKIFCRKRLTLQKFLSYHTWFLAFCLLQITSWHRQEIGKNSAFRLRDCGFKQSKNARRNPSWQTTKHYNRFTRLFD